MSALELRGLRISFNGQLVVDDVDLEVAAGECVAIVGESGAGKSLTVRALLGLTPDGAKVSADRLRIGETDARGLDERGWRALRGEHIALVSQDALVSLDPLRRIGAEVAEPLRLHRTMPRSERAARVRSLLEDVAVPEPERRAEQYPHELSGGLRQRALIASALAGDPEILVADEPTTALDATVQAHILTLIRSIARGGIAVVFVSHDFAAVRRVADRVIVMQHGRIVESGPVRQVLEHPEHPHTRELIAATAHAPREQGAALEPVLVRARGLGKTYDRPVVRDVDLEVRRGRTLGIVGESGSGKTTLARMIAGASTPDAGTLEIDGLTWARPAALRRRVQLVHQNPLGAFDPRWSVRRSLHEALGAGGVPRAERAGRADALLREVGLDPSLAVRHPAQLSGGQRQRAAIARALAVSPDVLVLDEPVSALDPTVREHVLELLRRLQRERDLTMLFVSHDLDVIAAIADDVVVMKDGVVVEHGAVTDVFAAPRHPFTRELLAAGAIS